jgi:hypothetical protein
MRIQKVVQAEQEVSIEIGWEDISEAIGEAVHEMQLDPTRRNALTYLLNQVGTVLKAITDLQIQQMQSGPRKIVQAFLSEQAKRYEEPKP